MAVFILEGRNPDRFVLYIVAPHDIWRRTGKQGGKACAAPQKTEHAGSSSKHVLYDCIAFLWGGIGRARRREIFAGELSQSYTRNGQVPAAVPPSEAGSGFQVQPLGRTASSSPLGIEAPRPGTYPSLVRRSRYVLSTGRSSDLVSSRPTAFSALRSSPLGQRLRPMACFVDAPLHSSGPVGESHSVPYSPRPPVQRRLQGTCEYPVILFSEGIIAYRLQKYNHIFCYAGGRRTDARDKKTDAFASACYVRC